jgi:glycosyltransferase involved in cell wall biosynthesis
VSEQADALFCVSDGDADYFRTQGARSVRVVPNGVDCGAYAHLPAGRRAEPPMILFLGAMSWTPNATAAVFLAREVFPDVRRRFAYARLCIVGRDPPSDVRALGDLPGVQVTGGVPSVLPYLEEASVLAVPLESGGGTRLKILEAFAAGLPVVSTPIGCEGLDVKNAEQLLIAPGGDFAAALYTLLGDDQLGARLAANARRLVRARFDWQAITDRACAILENVAR